LHSIRTEFRNSAALRANANSGGGRADSALFVVRSEDWCRPQGVACVIDRARRVPDGFGEEQRDPYVSKNRLLQELSFSSPRLPSRRRPPGSGMGHGAWGMGHGAWVGASAIGGNRGQSGASRARIDRFRAPREGLPGRNLVRPEQGGVFLFETPRILMVTNEGSPASRRPESGLSTNSVPSDLAARQMSGPLAIR